MGHLKFLYYILEMLIFVELFHHNYQVQVVLIIVGQVFY